MVILLELVSGLPVGPVIERHISTDVVNIVEKFGAKILWAQAKEPNPTAPRTIGLLEGEARVSRNTEFPDRGESCTGHSRHFNHGGVTEPRKRISGSISVPLFSVVGFGFDLRNRWAKTHTR